MMTAAVLFRAARGAREGWGLRRLFRTAARCGFELLRCGANVGLCRAVKQPVCAPQEAKRCFLPLPALRPSVLIYASLSCLPNSSRRASRRSPGQLDGAIVCFNNGGSALWPTDPEEDKCEALRSTDQVRCRAAARRIRAGDRGRASLRATDSRARKRCGASSGRPARRVRNDANAREGRQGRRRRRAQKNAEAVRPLQQNFTRRAQDEGWKNLLLV